MENLFLNIAEARVNGVDAEASYRRSVEWLPDGREKITARLLTSFLNENSTNNVGAPVRNEAGNSEPAEADGNGILGYDNGPFSSTLTGRWIDSRVQFNQTTVTPANSINNYEISSVFYLNAQVGYRFTAANTGDFNVYLNVQNVLDKAPPVVATWSDFFGASATTSNLHDTLGRRFALGVEMQF